MPANPMQGVVVPSITPFRADGEIDAALLAPYLDFLAAHVDAIVVGAIYGSGLLMRLDQRERLTQLVVATVRRRAAVLVFVGAADTHTAVDLARHAAGVGADALTCVTPFYYRHTDDALYEHFKAVVDATPLPVYAYDSPVYAGNELSLPVLRRLADSGLAGVVTGAAGHGIERVWDCINLLQGTDCGTVSMRDGLALPALQLGAVGFESGIANFYPELPMQLLAAARAGRHDEAARLQGRMLRLRDISHAAGRNIPTLHALIQLRGFPTGYPRRPFSPLTPAEVDRLRSRLAALDFPTPLLG